MPAELTHISYLHNPRQGDCIVFDADQWAELSAETQQWLVKQISWLVESEVQVICFTQQNAVPEALRALEKNNFLAANIADVSQLRNLINDLSVKPKRIIVLSSSSETGKIIQDNFSKNQETIPFVFAHYQSIKQIKINELSGIDSALLEKYDLVEGIEENKYKLRSSFDETLSPLVLIVPVNPDALKLEMICYAIYQLFGLKIPQGTVFTQLPAHILKSIQGNLQGFFYIYEEIQPAKDQEQAALVAMAKHTAIVRLALGNKEINLQSYVQTKDGKIVLEKMGENFFFDKQGNKKEKLISAVEINDSNDSKKKSCIQPIDAVNKKELKEQELILLKKENEIEKIFSELADKLNLPIHLRTEFLRVLSDRVDSLAVQLCPEVSRYAKLDRKVSNQTAAGVLTYAYDNGELKILLGKRNDTRTWDNFGGGSEKEDEFMFNTAARETHEESSQHFSYPPSSLIDCPFHDIITIKEGQPFIYRMYLREHSFVLAAEFSDYEHTEYKWVKLEDVLRSLEQDKQRRIEQVNQQANNKIVYSEEDTVTVISEGESFVLYSEFFHLIRQPAVEKNIAHLIEKKQLQIVHTQGKSDSFENNEVYLRRLHSPQEQVWQIKHTLLNHLVLLKELKSFKVIIEPKDIGKTSTKIEKLKFIKKLELSVISPEESKNNFMTQTEMHLSVVFREKYDPENLEHNVQLMLDDIFRYHRIQLKTPKALLIQHCVRLIKYEKKAGPGFVHFYHAVDNVGRFLYDFYSVIHEFLQTEPTWRAFRLSNEYFKPFPNIFAFIAHFSGASGYINNNDSHYHETTLSTNLFLGGGRNTFGSCSIEYLLGNANNRNIDLEKLLKTMLVSSGFPAALIGPLKKLYEKHYANKKGALYQITLPDALADTWSYAAMIGGNLNPYRGVIEISKIFALLRSDLCSNEPERIEIARNYMDTFQARLMVPPHLKFEVHCITDNDLNGIPETTALADSKTLIFNFIKELLFNSHSDMLHPSTIYEQQLVKTLEKNTLHLNKKASYVELKNAVENNDKNRINYYLNNDISLSQTILTLCIEASNHEIAGLVISNSPSFKTVTIKFISSYLGGETVFPELPLYLAIPTYVKKNQIEFMCACFGFDWKEQLPMGLQHNAKSMILALFDLPESERFAYATKYLFTISSQEESVGILKMLEQGKVRASFVTFLLNHFHDHTTYTYIFSSLPRVLEANDLILILNNFLASATAEQVSFLGVMVFSEIINNLNKTAALDLAKRYVALRPEVLTQPQNTQHGIDSLHWGVQSVANVHEFNKWVYSEFASHNSELKNLLLEKAAKSVPEMVYASKIVTGDYDYFRSFKIYRRREIEAFRATFNIYANPPQWFSIIELILLQGKNKVALLQTIYGDNWELALTDDCLTQYVKNAPDIRSLNEVFQLVSHEQFKMMMSIYISVDRIPLNFESARLLLCRLSIDKVQDILLALRKEFETVFDTKPGLIEFIRAFEDRMVPQIVAVVIKIFPNYFKTLQNYIDIFSYFDRNICIKAFSDKFLKKECLSLIKTADDFCSFYKLFLSKPYGFKFLLEGIDSYNSFGTWLEKSSPNVVFLRQGEEGFEAIRIINELGEWQVIPFFLQEPLATKLSQALADRKKDDYSLRFYSRERFENEEDLLKEIFYYEEFIEYFWEKLPAMVVSCEDFAQIYACLHSKRASKFFVTCFSKIFSLIKQEGKNFKTVYAQLNLIDKTEFLAEFKGCFNSLVSDPDFDFVSFSDIFSLEEQLELFRACSEALRKRPYIHTQFELVKLINRFDRFQFQEMCHVLQLLLKDVIAKPSSFFQSLRAQNQIILFSEWKEELSQLIVSDITEFSFIYECLQEEQKNELLNYSKMKFVRHYSTYHFSCGILFMSMSVEHFKEFFQFVMQHNATFISSIFQFENMCINLNDEKKKFIYPLLKPTLIAIAGAHDFMTPLRYLSPEQMEDYLKDCVRFTDNLKSLDAVIQFLTKLNAEAIAVVCKVLHKQWMPMIKTAEDFNRLMSLRLKDYQSGFNSKIIFDVFAHHILAIIMNENDYDKVSVFLPSERCSDLRLLITEYVVRFKQKYSELFADNETTFLTFFQPRFLAKLDQQSSIVAQFFFIKGESLANERVKKTMEALEEPLNSVSSVPGLH